MNIVIYQLQQNQLKAEKQLAELTEFKTTVKTAVDKYLEKKYAPLENALLEYGSWKGIKDAYGWDMISKKRYEQLLTLHLEKNEDTTAQYLADVLQYIDKKIEDTKRWLADTKSQLEHANNY